MPGTHASLILAQIILSVALPHPLLAQIASPSSAGGNAGNNATGSSISPVSSPNFSSSVVVGSSSSGITVQPTGTITATPAVINAAISSVSNSVSGVDSVLSPVATAAAPTVPAVKNDTAMNIAVAPAAGETRQVGSIGQLQQELSTMLATGETISIGALGTGNSGSLEILGTGVAVITSGARVELTVASGEQAAVAQFAAVAIVTGMSPAAMSAGASLVAVGAPPAQAAQLMLALQGMANATTLTSLSAGIDAYNAMIMTSNESTLQQLLGQDVFQAAGRTLSAARSAIGS